MRRHSGRSVAEHAEAGRERQAPGTAARGRRTGESVRRDALFIDHRSISFCHDAVEVDDLAAHLEESLAGAYHIVREIGGGGMSRVFQAEERAFGRAVVIKVLPPELAEIGRASCRERVLVAV